MKNQIVAEQLIGAMNESWGQLPDLRQASNAQRYEMADAAMSAFSAFYLQCPSFLERQREMERHKGRSNASSLFKIIKTPSDNQIRNLLDGVDEAEFHKDFTRLHGYLKESGAWEQMRDLGGTHLVALDGVQYFSSTKIECERCLQQQDVNGKIHYRHSAIVPVLVKPGRKEVIALMPEFIRQSDGMQKQDCELNGAKRWLQREMQQFEPGSVTILGDDLYAHEPFCRTVLAHGHSFLLTAKPASHEWMFEFIQSLEAVGGLQSLTVRHWKGRHAELSTFRWVSQVPLTASANPLAVNFLELTVTREDTGDVLYHSSWITNHTLTRDSVVDVAAAARARWKVENESHNTLKNHGYHFEHNFGHGKTNLSAVLLTINVLAFLTHTVQQLIDPIYQALRTELVTRRKFFNDLRALLTYQIFTSWQAFWVFMFDGLELPLTLLAPD